MNHGPHHRHPACHSMAGHCFCGEHDPAIRGYLIPCLLFLLQDAPSHGYQLAETLKERQYVTVTPDPGVIYRHLRRMEHEGLVKSGLESGAGPARKVYTITDEGQECLKLWVAELEKLSDHLRKFLSDITG